MSGHVSDGWNKIIYYHMRMCHIGQASPETEKRTSFHRLLSLSVWKRISVPILGKFWDEYRYSNALVFRWHSGIFYVTLRRDQDSSAEGSLEE